MATNNAINSAKPVGVASGGTGATTFTSNRTLVGAGTSPIAETAASGTNGQFLVGSTSAIPVWATVSSPLGSLTFTTGTNSLNIDIANYVDKTSWTPILKFGGGTTGITYTTQTGTYVRLGAMVIIQGEIVLSNKGSSTGNAQLTNLPLSNVGRPTWALNFENITYTTTVNIQFLSGNASSTISLNKETSGAGATGLTDTAFTNTSRVVVSGIYITS